MMRLLYRLLPFVLAAYISLPQSMIFPDTAESYDDQYGLGRDCNSPSIIFREVRDGALEGWLPLLGDEVPGFDHVALQIDGVVYETHPGYGMGTYFSKDGTDSMEVENKSGIQWQHTVETFIYNSRANETSLVLDYISIPIDRELANEMRSFILSVCDYQYIFVDQNVKGIVNNLSPSAQKGSNKSFTCVGLIEWASEQAGYNHGQGLVPDHLESVKFAVSSDASSNIEIPLLSPQLMYYVLKYR
ncbi:MAG: hypothetical protein IPL46_18660 [Saprospiraceae bacterium]|nr:hypothetical protein [Saprospiraceae bacterium]